MVRCASVTVSVRLSGPTFTFLVNVLPLPAGESDRGATRVARVEEGPPNTLTGASEGVVGREPVTGVVGGRVVVVCLTELVVIRDVVEGTELLNSVDDGKEEDKSGGRVDVVTVVELVPVKVVDGGKVVVDVVVVRSGSVVVVVNNVCELDVGGRVDSSRLVVDIIEVVVDGSLVSVGSVVVVVFAHAPTLVARSYSQPGHHLFGSPQQIPARNLYTPGTTCTSRRDIKP